MTRKTMSRLSILALLLVHLLHGGGIEAQQTAENQLCRNASRISPGDFVTGSTAGLTNDQGSTELDILRCGDGDIVPYESTGLWYFYGADAVRNLWVSTCSAETNFDSRITVFFLEDGNCLTRQCISSSIDDQTNCSYGNGTSVEFSTVPGVFAIYVHGESLESVGEFGLSMFEQSLPSDGVTCEGALELSHNETLQGTTIGSEYHDGLQCDRCIEGGGPSNPGVFLKIPPTSVSMGISISLVGANDRLFDLRVYTGACEALECQTIDTEISGDNVLTASWLAETNKSFYVYVSAAADNGDGDEDVTDRFGILMVQEERGDNGNGSKSSAASTGSWSMPAFFGLSSLLSVTFLFFI